MDNEPPNANQEPKEQLVLDEQSDDQFQFDDQDHLPIIKP